MDKDKIFIGLGAGLILSGIAAFDTFLTNRKLRRAARSMNSFAKEASDMMGKCIVDVQRDGKRMSAVSMITPGLRAQLLRK